MRAAPPYRRLSIPALLLAAVLPAVPASARETPRPESGRWADTTLALVLYSRDLCQELGAEVRGHWRGLGAGEEKVVQEMVVHRGMSRLASARAAGDLVRELMEGAGRDAGFEAGSSLQRLEELTSSLCDAVALPRGPRASFEGRFSDLSERIALEEEQLGRLLVIDQTRLAAAIEPYLTRLQLAGMQAEGELLDYLESLRKEPEPPTLGELMAVWHQGYVRGVQPTKEALRRFLRSRHKGEVGAIGRSCRDLIATVVPVLESRELLLAPDPRVRGPLRGAYTNLRRAASECARGRFDQVDKYLGEMQQDLQGAARRLAPHGLQP